MKTKNIILLFGLGALSAIGLYLYFRLSNSQNKLVLANFQSKLVQIAKEELNKWSSLTEQMVSASQILIDYWKSVGINFNPQQMQSSSVQGSYPWSSAFISYLFFKAGAKDKFPYASSHSGYFQLAKANRDNMNAPLRGFRISEYAPQVGDLIVYTRQSGMGYDSTGFFASHGELVIEKGQGFIKVIGGNVSNKVKESQYTTDSKGFLTQREQPFFMVIQNNIN